MFSSQELTEFLGFRSISDNQVIPVDQFNSLLPFIDQWSISTYSSDKSVCVVIKKLADGNIIARKVRDEANVEIFLRSGIMDSLTLAGKLAK